MRRSRQHHAPIKSHKFLPNLIKLHIINWIRMTLITFQEAKGVFWTIELQCRGLMDANTREITPVDIDPPKSLVS